MSHVSRSINVAGRIGAAALVASWARVQWQGPNAATVVNATIPLTAQGVGEVIVRDFGLMLRGIGSVGKAAGLPSFDRALLVGVSQSAWFVNTFVAEGFNVPPRGHGLHGRPIKVFEGEIGRASCRERV